VLTTLSSVSNNPASLWRVHESPVSLRVSWLRVVMLPANVPAGSNSSTVTSVVNARSPVRTHAPCPTLNCVKLELNVRVPSGWMVVSPLSRRPSGKVMVTIHAPERSCVCALAPVGLAEAPAPCAPTTPGDITPAMTTPTKITAQQTLRVTRTLQLMGGSSPMSGEYGARNSSAPGGVHRAETAPYAGSESRFPHNEPVKSDPVLPAG